MRLFRASGRMPELQPQALKNYVYRIAANLVNDHLRQRKQLPESSLDQAAELQALPGDLHSAAWDVSRAFRELSDRQQTLLWLAYVEEWEHAEIAQALKLGNKSIRTLLLRAREKMTSLLKKRGFNGAAR